MTRARHVVALALVAGCGQSTSTQRGPVPSAQSTSAQSVTSQSPSARAPTEQRAGSVDTNALLVAPKTLARKRAPAERRAADEAACDKGDVLACRKAADRYAGYGPAAGCGLDRGRPKPARAVTAADSADDVRAFERFLRRACELGDREACFQARKSPVDARLSSMDRDGCLRSRRVDCPLVLWQDELHPDWQKVDDAAREDALGGSWTYTQAALHLYRRDVDKTPHDGVPAKLEGLAERIVSNTLQSDAVLMMLDKAGYRPEELAPLRKKAGEVLLAACLDGDCTCAEAARRLDAADPRRDDLAAIACSDGDADGCRTLGDLRLRAGDEKGARALWEVACPAIVAWDGRPEVYSKLACDELAALYEDGKGVARDPERAYYYASLACRSPGAEPEHAPCLRLGRYEATGFGVAREGNFGRNTLYGPYGTPFYRKECERPSVKELCAPLRKEFPEGN